MEFRLTDSCRNFATERNSGLLEFKGSIALEKKKLKTLDAAFMTVGVNIMGCFFIISNSYFKRKVCMRRSKLLKASNSTSLHHKAPWEETRVEKGIGALLL